MSSPVTTRFLVDNPTILVGDPTAMVGGSATITAAVIAASLLVKGARVAKEEYEAALVQAQARFEAREARRLARLAARHDQMAALRTRVDRLEQKLARISALAEAELPDFAVRRDALHGADAAAWSAYVQELEARVAAVEGRLAANAGESVQAVLSEIGETPELSDLLRLYLARRQALRREADQETWRATVARILARLDQPPGEPLPPRLEALARAVILAETPERAELWGNELRLAVQLHRAEEAARQKDIQDAAAWLRIFPEDFLPASLNALLLEVEAGLSRLDAGSRAAIEALAAKFEAESSAQKNQAAAVVLEQSLRDLGYQVEAIDETLFSEGGIVHFQKPGWEGYYVRLRASAAERTFNFNVVRADTAEENAVRAQMDFMAEERWCSEFPKFMETLEARGVTLEIKRRVAAGELPVQVVPPERLPVFAEVEAERRRAALLARPLND
ncbi:MAG: hypothetical protein LBO79_00570 [Zoogloeaceae bacterium]|jgi:hypothetical protein|nr:hypothetical protein [Zoogloeaceae bacterium]